MDPNNPYRPVTNPINNPIGQNPPGGQSVNPSMGPKVFDLSALNSAGSANNGNPFKNKKLISALLVITLLIFGVGLGTWYIKFRTGVSPRATFTIPGGQTCENVCSDPSLCQSVCTGAGVSSGQCQAVCSDKAQCLHVCSQLTNTTPPPSTPPATSQGCQPSDLTFENVNFAHQGNVDRVDMSADAVNKCAQPATVYVYSAYCPDVKTVNGFKGYCESNMNTKTYSVPGASNGHPGTVHIQGSQLVNNTGLCGSAQLDAAFVGQYHGWGGSDAVIGRTAFLNSCTTTTYKHNVCDSSNACIAVDCNPATTDCSKATDCKTDADCQAPKTYSHNICNSNNTCISVQCNPATTDCSKSTDCKTNADCSPQTYKHNVCQGNSCTSVDCSPNNLPCASSCSNDSMCQTTNNPTHHECNKNNSCVVVQGAGTDQCTSDAMCAPAASAPPIPQSGNTALTIGGVVLGLGALLTGLFFAL